MTLSLITLVVYSIIKKLSVPLKVFRYIQVLPSTQILTKPVLIVESGLGTSFEVTITGKHYTE